MRTKGRTACGSALRAFPLLATLALVATGCAKPAENSPNPPQAGLSITPFAARCVQVQPARTPDKPTPGTPSTPWDIPTGMPSGEQQQEEMLRRQHAANKAFRQRGTLSEEAARGAQACADEILRAAQLRAASGDLDAKALEDVLVNAGLAEVTVRPPGRLDVGPDDGLIFAGWTGRACVFGTARQEKITVEIGTRIADGGCLPAPD